MEERELCYSHILPESVYRPAYDASHRAISIRLGTRGPGTIQKGWREHLLCPDCETRLNEYDDYFAKVWYAFPKLPKTVPDGPVVVEGLDYSLFKLFHLSVLWRAGVTAHAAFHNVSLGKKHTDALRRMLWDGVPGSPTCYPIAADLLVRPGTRDVLHGLVLNPGCHKLGAARLYYFLFGGCVWLYGVASHQMNSWKLAPILANGRLEMRWCDATAHPVWDEFISRQAVALSQTSRGHITGKSHNSDYGRKG